MVMPSAKHTSARLLLICVGLLGIALIADFLWASYLRFIRSYNHIADNWAPPVDISKPTIIPSPKKTGHEIPTKGSVDYKNDTAPGRVLSATFADLPGPELKWEGMAEAPVPHLDGAAIQIKNLLFLFAGYGTIDYLWSSVRIFLAKSIRTCRLAKMLNPSSYLRRHSQRSLSKYSAFFPPDNTSANKLY